MSDFLLSANKTKNKKQTFVNTRKTNTSLFQFTSIYGPRMFQTSFIISGSLLCGEMKTFVTSFL